MIKSFQIQGQKVDFEIQIFFHGKKICQMDITYSIIRMFCNLYTSWYV